MRTANGWDSAMTTVSCYECGHHFEREIQNCPLCRSTNIFLAVKEDFGGLGEIDYSKPDSSQEKSAAVDSTMRGEEKALESRSIIYSIDRAIEAGILKCGDKYLSAIYSESKVVDGKVVVICKGTTIGEIKLAALP